MVEAAVEVEWFLLAPAAQDELHGLELAIVALVENTDAEVLGDVRASLAAGAEARHVASAGQLVANGRFGGDLDRVKNREGPNARSQANLRRQRSGLANEVVGEWDHVGAEGQEMLGDPGLRYSEPIRLDHLSQIFLPGVCRR